MKKRLLHRIVPFLLPAALLTLTACIFRHPEPAPVPAPAPAEQTVPVQVGGHTEYTPRIENLPKSTFDPEKLSWDSGVLHYPGAENGIDVSSHQGEVDWQKVREAGIDFVILRAAYRGYESGALVADPRFAENYAGASAAGLKVGAYVFSQAITEEEAAEEAQFVADALDGAALELPIYFDWEYVGGARADSLTPAQLTDNALSFCRTAEQAGYTGGVYFSFVAGYLNYDLGRLKDYPFWLAMYQNDMSFYYDISMWQYSSEGTVPGISEAVDLNLKFS